MTLSFGGGAGVLTIPGLSADGQTPGGIVVAGELNVGDASASATAEEHAIWGALFLGDAPANVANQDRTLYVAQSQPLGADDGAEAVLMKRSGLLHGHQYTGPTLHVQDISGSTANLQEWSIAAGTKASLGQAGGLGLFGHPAPAAPSTLPQATITAILDPNTKTAVQALADCLAAIGVLTIT